MQARLTNQRFSHKEVFNRLRQTLMEKADNEMYEITVSADC